MENQIIKQNKKDIAKVLPYNIGLALSGGGAKGFAHLGALQALEENGIKPDIISQERVPGPLWELSIHVASNLRRYWNCLWNTM